MCVYIYVYWWANFVYAAKFYQYIHFLFFSRISTFFLTYFHLFLFLFLFFQLLF
jgi:hypothetical protein